MDDAKKLTLEELEAGLDEIRRSGTDAGELRMIVRRPAENERESLQRAELDPGRGLAGDGWIDRPSRHTGYTAPDPESQITLMNSRAIGLIAGPIERWSLAGDQLYVDLDLSEENLPPGTHLAIGDAEMEVTARPHTGCAKFAARFGVDALKFVNTPASRAMRLRGMYAKVVRGGTIRVGDMVTRID